ncbi:MAG: flagellar protein FlgN [Chromatiales bacterium]|jgi:flagellar biosynthesis/type III secretory pathway chaperone
MTQTSGQGSRKQLLELLREQNRVAADLSAALDNERALIATRDEAGLEQAVRDKAELVARLESLEIERLGQVQALTGQPGDRADFESVAAELDTSGELGRLWRSLAALSLSCREKNLANNNLVTLSLQAVGEALAILRGGESPTATYDPLGRTVSGGDSRSLAKA